MKAVCFCQVIREALQKDISVMEKSSPVDLVTETDQRVEQFIISSIKEKFPTHRWIFILFQVWLYLTLVCILLVTAAILTHLSGSSAVL